MAKMVLLNRCMNRNDVPVHAPLNSCPRSVTPREALLNEYMKAECGQDAYTTLIANEV